MLCQICNLNEAVIHLTQFNEGKPQQMHICEKCAHERGEMKFGIEIPVEMSESGFALPFSLDNFFNNFVKNILPDSNFSNMKNFQNKDPHDNLGPGSDVCMHCGMTLDEYLETGEARCDKCYDTFRPRIVRQLESYLRNNYTPEKNEDNRDSRIKLNEILRLRSDLEISVMLEDYETASLIRDRILSITNSMK